MHILSFLTVDEMNDATLINSRFCETRNEPPLDQPPTATMELSENMSVQDLYDAIASSGWQLLFHANSNKTRLKIVGVERLSYQPDGFNSKA